MSEVRTEGDDERGGTTAAHTSGLKATQAYGTVREPNLSSGRDETPAGSAVDSEARDDVVRYTGRWAGVSALALFAAGVGLTAHQPAAFLLGVFGVVFAAYARAGSAPAASLTVERECSDERPDPDQEVTITVTVRNDGETSVSDLRLVDGVPSQLHVREGTPRRATTLGPGRSTTLSYTVVAQRGTHEFDPLRAIARGFSGAVERDALVESETDVTIRCTPTSLPPSAQLSLQPLTTPFAGRVQTDIGGDGVEFHATREYQPGDPLSRVDWNRRARTGELATCEFREERAASVVLLIDVRTEAWCRPNETSTSAVDRSVEGAMQVFSALLDDGDRVGVASLGTTDCWLPPGSGGDHRAQARELFLTHDLLTPTSVDDLVDRAASVTALRKQLAGHSQVILFSPLCDDQVVAQAKLLDASGHLVTVVSPDPTTDGTFGRSIAGIERTLRQSGLRRSRLRVLDWQWEESLANAVSRASERWSA